MKTVALIAHDTQKAKIAEFVNSNKDILKKFNLVGTRGTAKIIEKTTGLRVRPLGHGPDGGDVIVANHILEGNIDAVFFFIDARNPHGHEHDIQTLIRIAVIKNIPLALNQQSAEFLIKPEFTRSE